MCVSQFVAIAKPFLPTTSARGFFLARQTIDREHAALKTKHQQTQHDNEMLTQDKLHLGELMSWKVEKGSQLVRAWACDGNTWPGTATE